MALRLLTELAREDGNPVRAPVAVRVGGERVRTHRIHLATAS
eukprot:gene3424-3711_t